MAINSVNNGNVLLIDPMDAVSDLPQDLNGTPNYEEMFIFVSLRTRRRRRSVIKFEAGDTSLVESQVSDTNINMLGYDTESGNYTTKWTESETNSGTILEGFGVTNISIKTNSSYIPQVTIEFTDIKGLAFFNKGSSSPYQAIFDFPPPLFDLTVKGYYGKSLTYQLHLVRHSTQFQAETGNFVITAEFIARTFAPLTDVPFKYIDILPLIKQETQPPVDPKTQEQLSDGNGTIDTQRQTPNVKLPPRSTHEFILKLRNLYDNITTIKKTSEESEELDDAEERLRAIQANISLLDNFKNIFENENQQSGALIIIAPDDAPDGEDVPQAVRITNLSQYDQKIQARKTEGRSVSKVKASPNNGNNRNTQGVNEKVYLAVEITGNTINRSNVNTLLNTNFRRNLITDAKINDTESKDLIADSDLDHIFRKNVNGGYTKRSFVALDITGYYVKLYNARETAIRKRNDARLLLTAKINNTVIEELGFEPTIYNVWKIICDDVDAFFNILRKTNVDAENHHQKFANQIFGSGSNGIEQQRVSAFPLYVSGNTGKCNVNRKVRQYPIRLSEQVQENGGEPFPEITLVDNFISAFIRLQKELLVRDLRSQEDGEGNNKWIPITPFDSELLDAQFGRRKSPYKDMELQYNGDIDQNIDKYFNKILERYYVLSQYTFGRSFYEEEGSLITKWVTDKEYKNQELIEAYAEGEAYNIAISLTNRKTINALREEAIRLKAATIGVISQRFDNPNVPSYRDVNILTDETTSNYLTIGNKLDPTVTDEGERLYTGEDIERLYKSRDLSTYREGENTVYKGFLVRRGGAVLRNDNVDSSDNPIDKYINKASDGWLRNALNYLRGTDEPVVFTEENVVYNNDVDRGEDFTTKYINGFDGQNISDSDDRIPISFEDRENIYVYKYENSLSDVLGDILADNRTALELIELFTGDSYQALGDETSLRQAKSLLLGSNFFKSRSFYHQFSLDKGEKGQVNSGFLFPSVNEVPYFTLIYMGGLIAYNNSGNTNFIQDVDGLINKFILPNENEQGAQLGLENGERDVANFKLDAFYLDKLLLEQDKDELLLEQDKDGLIKIFNDFANQEYFEFERSYLTMLLSADNDPEFIEFKEELDSGDFSFSALFNNIIENIGDGARLNTLQSEYKSALVREMKSGSKVTVMETLLEPYQIIVPSEFSFFIPEFNAEGEPQFDELETSRFVPLTTTNTDSVKANVNQIYFRKLFATLADELEKQDDVVENIEKQAQRSISDNDIKGTLYYSFKSISDKWIAGLGADVNKGFPLNNGGDSLIDKFMFVDRAMNPIGSDCIIDVEPLLDLVNDYDVNVFSVMSTLLSHNGFEFFPLQNFMSFENDKWEDSFKVTESVDQEANPAFVCMYIGGAASQLNNDASEYEDDGIRDLSEGGLQDFSGDCGDDEGVQETVGSDQPYSQVRAFRVRFAEQNQSLFNSIQLDGREFTETNDSLAILSKIAGDESNTSPIAKGQNLYSVYQNRAYSAKVKMLGNMMIQPTQYFQLENIPMYSGAYVILDVEHTITPNHAVTEFQGTKILKFPNPIVTDFAVSVGFQSGTAEDLSANVTLEDVKSSPLYDEAVSSGFLNAIDQPIGNKSVIEENNTLIRSLHPQVRNRFADLFKAWENEGYVLQINSAFRSNQDQLNVSEKDANGNPIATPGRSFHQYGLAVDVSLRKLDKNGVPTAEIYNKDQNKYWDFPQGNPPNVFGSNIAAQKSIAQIAEENGFRWGGRFKNDDPVHFEFTLGYGYFNNDISKENIYCGGESNRPRYDIVGTIDDLILKFKNGERIGRYIIFDDEVNSDQIKNLSYKCES